ncbi:MAG: hypothetical protein Ta2D_08350 [Rickettsiales bacterium]|nr:MAG: hypothetical protein Ta2D_08350 [Rickettsiales bacterium]
MDSEQQKKFLSNKAGLVRQLKMDKSYINVRKSVFTGNKEDSDEIENMTLEDFFKRCPNGFKNENIKNVAFHFHGFYCGIDAAGFESGSDKKTILDKMSKLKPNPMIPGGCDVCIFPENSLSYRKKVAEAFFELFKTLDITKKIAYIHAISAGNACLTTIENGLATLPVDKINPDITFDRYQIPVHNWFTAFFTGASKKNLTLSEEAQKKFGDRDTIELRGIPDEIKGPDWEALKERDLRAFFSSFGEWTDSLFHKAKHTYKFLGLEKVCKEEDFENIYKNVIGDNCTIKFLKHVTKNYMEIEKELKSKGVDNQYISIERKKYLKEAKMSQNHPDYEKERDHFAEFLKTHPDFVAKKEEDISTRRQTIAPPKEIQKTEKTEPTNSQSQVVDRHIDSTSYFIASANSIYDTQTSDSLIKDKKGIVLLEENGNKGVLIATDGKMYGFDSEKPLQVNRGARRFKDAKEINKLPAGITTYNIEKTINRFDSTTSKEYNNTLNQHNQNKKQQTMAR